MFVMFVMRVSILFQEEPGGFAFRVPESFGSALVHSRYSTLT